MVQFGKQKPWGRLELEGRKEHSRLKRPLEESYGFVIQHAGPGCKSKKVCVSGASESRGHVSAEKALRDR